MDTKAILQAENITKRYPGTVALNDVKIEIMPGEVHTIVGENGAGKSTLMKVLAAAVTPDEGTIKFEGENVRFQSPKEAADKGIGIIYQEFNLFPEMTVEENIMIGNEKRKGVFVKKRENIKRVRDVLKQLNVNISANTYVKHLGIAQQQLVEIAKSISKKVKVLIMDEPTAALTQEEIGNLFNMINTLKANGVAVIYISHKFDEIFAISDRVTVLRDGEYIATKQIEELDHDRLVQLMVGRQLNIVGRSGSARGNIALNVHNLSSEGKIKQINFTLHKGEVLGVAGLMGSGRTELAKTLYGHYPMDSGTVEINGKTIKQIKSPLQALKLGIGLIPEDRKKEGLVLEGSCETNISLPSLKKFVRAGFIKGRQEKEIILHYKEQLAIKYQTHQLAKQLSGGNQQKLVIAKMLATDVDVLIFDEPTRGVDIGAKQEIYKLMDELLQQGKAIIMISSEMEEVMNLSHRIAVMKEGELMDILPQQEATQEKIMQIATGVKQELGGLS
ncbi:ribose ABC transport system, ATP-binding protein RbsA [Geomicrobium sp. JCM 19037]|uniref:sugar ABC transporter ATP-binding protein n=1 Tax=Geomicrobium sp. JCM 19037 TaxID=1460634 RepID=UPI00045F448A|nr:sugar ABC transporter ATP-binding protein [Geomicrobium sp. JCM 19037]GAK03493.1 ribose ABC transport system, ATP-binding protein RbsA [Geomicrobium sp. JCM 19037]